MEPATSTPRGEVRLALDANVHEGLRLATGVLAGLLAFFALSDMLVTPPPWTFQVAMVDLGAAGILLAAHALLRSGRVPVQQSHLLGTLVSGVIGLDILHDTYVLGDPQQTTYLMLVVVGCGAIFLSTRWVVTVAVCAFLSWSVVAALRPEAYWTTFGFALFAACVLAVLVHIVRLQTFQRMEALRLAEAGRKEQLEIRESALESAVEALQESEERYRRLVEGAPDAFLVHSDGKIVYVNAAGVRLFRANAPQDLLGRDAWSLVHPEDQERVRARNRQIEQESIPTEPMEIRCVRLDGTIIDVETQGQPITYLGRPADQTVIRDITDRKRAEAERIVASQRLGEISRLKEMDRVKTQFVNTISHELRTPLTPIKVQLHILKGSRTPEQLAKATEVLERNVGRLSGLVDELLEVARIQAGTLKLAKTYVDLSANVQHTLDSYVDVARQNGIELSCKLEPNLTVLGDPKRLTQVMYNLLGNAFKFTERGGRILVEVRREKDRALVTVRDSGAGMNPDDIARLFEPFSQVHDTMEKTNAGTGLGLYICRGIVEGHGGRIWAESDGPGKGSRFVFSIPLS